MKRLFLLVGFLPLLSACHKGVVQREGMCQLDATKFAAEHSEKLAPNVGEGDLVELCMRGHGYAFMHSRMCPGPDEFKEDPKLSLPAENEAENPVCYVPIGWFARQLHRVDLWIWLNL
jgi:hypothetical protein